MHYLILASWTLCRTVWPYLHCVLGETVVKGACPNHKVSHAEWGLSWGQSSFCHREGLRMPGLMKKCVWYSDERGVAITVTVLFHVNVFLAVCKLGSGHNYTISNITLSIPSFMNAKVGQKDKIVIISALFFTLWLWIFSMQDVSVQAYCRHGGCGGRLTNIGKTGHSV